MAIVLVDEDIILLGLSWLLMVRLGREAEVCHLRALRQQAADGGVVGHDDRHAPSTAGGGSAVTTMAYVGGGREQLMGLFAMR